MEENARQDRHRKTVFAQGAGAGRSARLFLRELSALKGRVQAAVFAKKKGCPFVAAGDYVRTPLFVFCQKNVVLGRACGGAVCDLLELEITQIAATQRAAPLGTRTVFVVNNAAGEEEQNAVSLFLDHFGRQQPRQTSLSSLRLVVSLSFSTNRHVHIRTYLAAAPHARLQATGFSVDCVCKRTYHQPIPRVPAQEERSSGRIHVGRQDAGTLRPGRRKAFGH